MSVHGTAGAGKRRDRLCLVRRCEGQALAETSIVIVLLVILSMGIVEFGRAWMIGNVLTHAARDGARAAAMTPTGNRDSAGMIQSTSAVVTLVETQLSTVVSGSPTVSVAQGSTSGLPVVTVTVSLPVNYIFNLVGTGFTMNRSVTFRDEGR